MSSLSNASFRLRICTRLMSASCFSRASCCSAAGRSASSSGALPSGRGILPRPNCMRRFWMTASRSCSAVRISLVGCCWWCCCIEW